MTTNSDSRSWNPLRWPLYARVILGVAAGAALGMAFGQQPILFGWTTAHLGELGMLVIRLLTALATPLIFFAILDAFVHTEISGRQGAKLVAICVLNVAVAFTIGLAIMNVWQPGLAWRGERFSALAEASKQSADNGQPAKTPGGSLSPLENLKGYIPTSVARAFVDNNVLSVVLLAILLGAAMRSLRGHLPADRVAAHRTLEQAASAAYWLLLHALEWIVQVVPLAVCGIVAQVVGDAGLGVFELVWVYLATVLTGLALHAFGYYPLAAWLVGGKPPWVYVGRGVDGILTGLSTNSSLATVPVTLRCLDRMGVSETSARLSACVGTNFNNDGITLYEAMTALFVAQAAGYDLSLMQQVAVILASLMASVGIAGIPGSGLIVLPLVLSAAGIDVEVIAVVLPLIQAVDWIAARCRSAVNVMGDMCVAILLDAGRPPEIPPESADRN